MLVEVYHSVYSVRRKLVTARIMQGHKVNQQEGACAFTTSSKSSISKKDSEKKDVEISERRSSSAASTSSGSIGATSIKVHFRKMQQVAPGMYNSDSLSKRSPTGRANYH